MEEAARAKVNLFLRVVGRRADGYHLLDSLAVFPGVGDVVRAEAAEGLTLRVEGPFAGMLTGEGVLTGERDNLVLRAARALAAVAGVPAHTALTLDKRLPVASGIGGGSADAAAALRGLNRLWGLGLDGAALEAVAAGLGADVPVCVASAAARMEGVGEVLGAAPALPAFGMALVNPLVGVSTPEVFRARKGWFSARAVLPERWADAAALAQDVAALGNDLQAPAVALCPAVGDVLAWLRRRPGCLVAQMSGSGATCFGMFADRAEAEAAGAAVPAGWWGWGGSMPASRMLA